MLLFALILAFLSAGVLGIPVVNEETPKGTTVWGPTAKVFYWRCQPPFLVEVSDNRLNWVPSSICLEGTCCSPQAPGPLCTKEACGMFPKEEGRPEGQLAMSNTQQRAPKRPDTQP